MCGSCRRGRSRGEGVGCELFFFDCTAGEIVGIVSHDLLCSAPGVNALAPARRRGRNGSSARAAEREVTGAMISSLHITDATNQNLAQDVM
jgi:hypothetical protein